MRRLGLAFFLCSLPVLAQSSPQVVASDSLAISLAQKSTLALTGGVQVSDATLNANVTSILGSDSETGTGTFQVKHRHYFICFNSE